VIVVDDGSTDGTGAIVTELGLPRVRLMSQPNAGKPAALNRALEAARHDILVTVDADTVFEPDALLRLVQRFREPAVGAISGNTKVGNRRRLLGRWQHIEYVMGFNLDRRMYEVLGFMPTVPGAIGAFRRQALADIGGVSGATLAEDTDITLDIGRAGWKVVYAEDARAWTEAPATVAGLYRQRSRWAFGTIQSIWKHRAALWSRGRSGFGRRAIAYLALFQVGLPLVAPLIDLFALYSILFLDPLPILAFWFAFNAFQFLLAWFAFGFDREPRRVLWALPLQQFVYRQVMYLVVIDAVISALLGTRLGWRRAERTGDIELSAA
jgi:cellulose synthase/poly-beta-1,6-N-acetylglucosamine synthase-like glycosyltransferase